MAPLRRDQLFQLRMTAEEKEILNELADEAGLTASDYLRQLVRQEGRKRLLDTAGGVQRVKPPKKATSTRPKRRP